MEWYELAQAKSSLLFFFILLSFIEAGDMCCIIVLQRQGSECRELLMATPCAKGLALTGSCSVGYTGAGCRSCAENYFRLNGQCSKWYDYFCSFVNTLGRENVSVYS